MITTAVTDGRRHESSPHVFTGRTQRHSMSQRVRRKAHSKNAHATTRRVIIKRVGALSYVIADCLNGFNPLSTPSKQGRPVRHCGRFKRELRTRPSLRTCPSFKPPLPLPSSLLALPIGNSRPSPLPLLALLARCRARRRNCGRPLLTIVIKALPFILTGPLALYRGPKKH